jgi:ATP-dependent Clp protease adaptor protein ClpS
MPEQTMKPAPEPPDQGPMHENAQGACNVLIHNDDVTPFDFVIHTLSSVFMLSDELAEHIAATAHDNGVAVVAIRPRAEAEMLMRVALGRAKKDGYPLQFTLEEK